MLQTPKGREFEVPNSELSPNALGVLFAILN